MQETTEKSILTIVGRFEPKTGGEFYNLHAISALAECFSFSRILQVSDLPSLLRYFSPKLNFLLQLFGNIKYSMIISKRRYAYCFIDYFMFPFAWIPCFIIHRQGGKILVVVHDLYHVTIQNLTFKKIKVFIQHLFLKNCDLIIATSLDTEKRLQTELHLDHNRIRVIPPGIYSSNSPKLIKNYNSMDGMHHVLYVGMVNKEKGLLDLVRALKLLVNKDHKLVLHVAGRTDIEPNYYKQVREESLRGCVETVFHGFLNRHELDRLYDQAHIFVLPSRYETYGMVIAEAMAHGLPIVATDSGGIPELIESGKSGLLYKAGDIEKLSEYIQQLVESPSLRQNLGENALAKARPLPSWDDLQNAFKSLIQPNSPHSVGKCRH